MTNAHLTDEEIQDLASNDVKDQALPAHIHECRLCATRLAEYRILLNGILKLEQPSFDFDLADAVVSQLPLAKKTARSRKYFYYLVVIGIVAGSLVLFQLYGNSLVKLFGGIAPIVGGLTGIGIAGILVTSIVDLYRRYKMQIKSMELK